jgi:hypothetical protein
MARIYSESDIAAIDAAITDFITAKATPSTWFGTKERHGGAWSGTITAARRMHERLSAEVPDNLTPTSVTTQWRAAVSRLGDIING